MTIIDNSIHELQKQLFFLPRTQVFAVLDGAAIPVLLKKIYEHEPKFYCLLWGWTDLPPKLVAAAPYLVQLEKDSAFTQWVLSGYGKYWGIFVITGAGLQTMRGHFREFLWVQDTQGRNLWFRFYDPRVLNVYLPTCNEEEKRMLFGPVLFYLAENEQSGTFLRFSL